MGLGMSFFRTGGVSFDVLVVDAMGSEIDDEKSFDVFPEVIESGIVRRGAGF